MSQPKRAAVRNQLRKWRKEFPRHDRPTTLKKTMKRILKESEE